MERHTSGASGLQKGKLFKLLLALPLKHHQPSCTISRCVEQVVEFLLGHLSGPTLLCKLTLKEVDFPDKALYVFMSRCLRRGILHLCTRHPLSSRPLYQGGLILRVPDANYSATSWGSSLLSRCFCIKHHCNMGGLCSGGRLSCPGQPRLQLERVCTPSRQML
jgi:hypothetical protein